MTMTIKNIVDLDQEILLLQAQEGPQKNELIAHIITPSAAFHTMTGILIYWIRQGGKNNDGNKPFNVLAFASKILSPLKLLRTVLDQSGYIFKSIGFAISQTVAYFIHK